MRSATVPERRPESLAGNLEKYADRLVMPCLEGQLASRMAEQIQAGAVTIDLTYQHAAGREAPSLQRYNQALGHLQLFMDEATALGYSILRSDAIEG